MSVSWGKVLGGVAAVTGIAVAGVGLGGGSIAASLGDGSAIGHFFGDAATKIAENAESAAKAIGLSEEVIKSLGGGKGIAAIVGGMTALGGGAALAFSGNSQQQQPQNAQDQQLSDIISMLPPEAKAQLLAGLKMALGGQSPQGLPPIPGGKSQGLA
jgi:hypothetical protein